MPPRTTSRRPTVLTVLASAAIAVLAVPGASAAPAAPLAPSGGRYDPGVPTITGDFPDPDVLQVSGTFHAYASNGAGNTMQHATSPDLRDWTVQADIIPELGDWASATCSQGDVRGSTSCVWAPEVTAMPGAGTFTLYYAARRTGTDRQCIGVATAATPAGPFVPDGTEPLICPEQGAIDPSVLTDDDGSRYVLWKVDGNSVGQPTGGPYVKDDGPVMSTDLFGARVVGPGGADLITFGDGSTRIAFHGWNAAFTSRPTYVHGVVWPDDVPRVLGSR